jgi:RNA polymerase sigma-70 factor (ECF subfamily)
MKSSLRVAGSTGAADRCPGSAASDQVLALAAGQRDPTAFHALYARHYPQVHSFVTRLGVGSDCDDVIQEVFLQLYRALPGFRADSSLVTFLRRITMNVGFDYLRRRYRHQRIAYDNDALEMAADSRQDPEQHSSSRQQLGSLLRHLDGIAPDKQRALILVAVAGLSLHDAAAQLGVKPDWIKQRIVRARRELTAMTARPGALRRRRRVDPGERRAAAG